MGAVRGKKKADPTITKEAPCQPASLHVWEERQRVWIGCGVDAINKRGNVRFEVTWRCRKCKTVIKLTTKAVSWPVLTKPWKYPKPRKPRAKRTKEETAGRRGRKLPPMQDMQSDSSVQGGGGFAHSLQ